MTPCFLRAVCFVGLWATVSFAQNSDTSTIVSGELKQWHAVTLTMDGPAAREVGTDENPFTDYAMNVTFMHTSGSPTYLVPGYFAADGDAGNSGATAGTNRAAPFVSR